MFETVLRKLEKFIEKEDWCGWDPYDGLNSKCLKFFTFNRKWFRIGAIQFMKRVPINLRPLLGVPKLRNSKAMGIIASAYLERYKKTKNQKYLDRARKVLDWLITHSCAGYEGYAWGHNFDWQSALFYLPNGMPTIVNTSFIANSFLDAYEVLKEKSYFDIANSACNFVLYDLNRTVQNNLFCFSYSPIDTTCIHNANALAAELLARMYSFTRKEELFDHSNKAIKFTMQHQNTNGSWFYGLGQRQRYIDSFHTGFVLVSLGNILNYLECTNESRYRKILMKGYEYYQKTFFGDDGLPYYYHNKIFPIDLHGSAQGIITFLKFQEFDSDSIERAKKVAQYAIENMWDDERGYFYFQKTSHFTNQTPYLRWPNAWMYYALTLLQGA